MKIAPIYNLVSVLINFSKYQEINKSKINLYEYLLVLKSFFAVLNVFICQL